MITGETGYVRQYVFIFHKNSPNSMKSSAQRIVATMTSSVSPTLCHMLAGLVIAPAAEGEESPPVPSAERTEGQQQTSVLESHRPVAS